MAVCGSVCVVGHGFVSLVEECAVWHVHEALVYKGMCVRACVRACVCDVMLCVGAVRQLVKCGWMRSRREFRTGRCIAASRFVDSVIASLPTHIMISLAVYRSRVGGYIVSKHGSGSGSGSSSSK